MKPEVVFCKAYTHAGYGWPPEQEWSCPDCGNVTNTTECPKGLKVQKEWNTEGENDASGLVPEARSAETIEAVPSKNSRDGGERPTLTAPSPSDAAAGWCPACKGSGEAKGMTQQHGPDDYEVDIACPVCKGTGAGPMREADAAAKELRELVVKIDEQRSTGRFNRAAAPYFILTVKEWEIVRATLLESRQEDAERYIDALQTLRTWDVYHPSSVHRLIDAAIAARKEQS